MADAAKAKASKAVRRAQADFERSHEHHERCGSAAQSFEDARAAGLSMREIGEAAGLHFTRVARILQVEAVNRCQASTWFGSTSPDFRH